MNELLQSLKAALIEKVDPRLRKVVAKIVEQGERVMYSEQTRDMSVEQLRGATDPESVGAAVAKLSVLLLNQSKNTIPMPALVPATQLLLVEALSFLEEAGTVQITPDFLAECTEATMSAFLQALGATPEMLQGMVAKNGGGEPAAPAQPAQPPAGGGGLIAQAMGGA